MHLVIKECGELLACQITPGNVDDRAPVPTLCKRLFGKLIAERHGGKVEVESQFGKGSTFYLQIPPVQSREAQRVR